jgi:ribosomal protein S18 acetylase RimI-like enzyme
VVRRDRYVVVRSPSNPSHYWGNSLLFDDPPVAGDRESWERCFELEFATEPRVRHRTFAWDRVDGASGEAHEEFVVHGYRLERRVGLVAGLNSVHAHPRANDEVTIRALNSGADSDAHLWAQVLELQVASRDERLDEDEYRAFGRRRLADLRALFRGGRGAWYVALGAEGNVVGSCGIVVTGSRGRFQAVDTAAAHRRRGVCSRLVVEAAKDATERYGARRLLIAADPDYHALGLYESLGFKRTELVCGLLRDSVRTG